MQLIQQGRGKNYSNKKKEKAGTELPLSVLCTRPGWVQAPFNKTELEVIGRKEATLVLGNSTGLSDAHSLYRIQVFSHFRLHASRPQCKETTCTQEQNTTVSPQ